MLALGKEKYDKDDLRPADQETPRVVRPNAKTVFEGDIGIKDDKFSRTRKTSPLREFQVYDARNLLAFPGVVDAHMHAGSMRR